MKKVLSEIAYRIKRNPVLIGTAALWGYDALTAGDPFTWRGGIMVGVGVIVRSRVVPAHEAKVIAEVLGDILHTMHEEPYEGDVDGSQSR